MRLSPLAMIKNFYQRVTLTLGTLAIAILALFPPWKFVYRFEGLRIERFAGYHPIWLSNAPTDQAALSKILSIEIRSGDLGLVSAEIDTTRLTIQMAAIIIVTLLVSAVLAGNRKSPN